MSGRALFVKKFYATWRSTLHVYLSWQFCGSTLGTKIVKSTTGRLIFSFSFLLYVCIERHISATECFVVRRPDENAVEQEMISWLPRLKTLLCIKIRLRTIDCAETFYRNLSVPATEFFVCFLQTTENSFALTVFSVCPWINTPAHWNKK